MPEPGRAVNSIMSLLWLRVALGCYAVGLIYALVALTRTSELLGKIALHAAYLGMVFHFVSLMESVILSGQIALASAHHSISVLGFLQPPKCPWRVSCWAIHRPDPVGVLVHRDRKAPQSRRCRQSIFRSGASADLRIAIAGTTAATSRPDLRFPARRADFLQAFAAALRWPRAFLGPRASAARIPPLARHFALPPRLRSRCVGVQLVQIAILLLHKDRPATGAGRSVLQYALTGQEGAHATDKDRCHALRRTGGDHCR